MINGLPPAEYHRLWYQEHREEIAQKRKGQWSRFTPEQKIARVLASNKCRVKRLYGLGWDQYLELIESVKICPICNLPFKERHGKVIDHTRKGTFHGVICMLCNTAIGALMHDPDVMERAIKYVENTR